MKRNRRILPWLALQTVLLSGCASDNGGYVGTSAYIGYGYSFYDPWYDRGDIIINPPARPPVRPEHPIARPPVMRPTPLPARPMPRPAPGRMR